jgi:hypothetical protein
MDTDAVHVAADRRPGELPRALGILGLLVVPLLFVPTIAISSLGEPPFDGSPADITRFFSAMGGAPWASAASAGQCLGSLALLWWAVGIVLMLRSHEGEPGWRSTAALGSIVVFTAYVVLEPFWATATARGGVSGDLAVFAFDAGNVGFANAWLALGSFAVACGWVALATRSLPTWLGWLALGSGLGFVLARLVWTSSAWLVPYTGFWVWVVSVSVVLLRRGASARRASPID